VTKSCRNARPPWTPSFGFALRMLLLIRVTAAMYSNIDDCDEGNIPPVHPTCAHYLSSLQFLGTSSLLRQRLWLPNLGSHPSVRHTQLGLYLDAHPPRQNRSIPRCQRKGAPGSISTRIISLSLFSFQRVAFFAVRIFLAGISSLAEVTLYRAVCDKVNLRVGRYLFFILFFSAGMWNASAALLPSSFAMYTTTFAFAFSMIPATTQNARRTLFTTLMFATGAIIGWPFALALAIPFVFEELFILSGDKVLPASYTSWLFARWKRLVGAGALASLIFVGLFFCVPFLIPDRRKDPCRLYRHPCLWQTVCGSLQHCFIQHIFVRSWTRFVWHFTSKLLFPQPSTQL